MINPANIQINELPSVALADRGSLPEAPSIYFAVVPWTNGEFVCEDGTMIPTKRSLTAIHEASHCCLYTAFGVVINGVRINPDGTGRVHRYNFDPLQEPLPLMINAQDGAISIAGVVGEAIHEHGEVELNAILAKLMFGGGQSDYDRIQQCGVDHLIEALMTFSYSVLMEHWGKVLRLAARLEQVQYLDSDEISSELPYVCDVSRYSAQLQKEIGSSGTRWTWNPSIKRGLMRVSSALLR